MKGSDHFLNSGMGRIFGAQQGLLRLLVPLFPFLGHRLQESRQQSCFIFPFCMYFETKCWNENGVKLGFGGRLSFSQIFFFLIFDDLLINNVLIIWF